MGEDWFKNCLPVAYYDQFIGEGIYPDGRSISAFVPLSFKLGAWGGVGSSLIRHGGVAVSCCAQASLALSIAPVLDHRERDVLGWYIQLVSKTKLSIFTLICCKTNLLNICTVSLPCLTVKILSSSGPIADVAICAVSAALLNVHLPAIKLAHSKDNESPIEAGEITVLDEVWCFTILLQSSQIIKQVVNSTPPKKVITCSTFTADTCGPDFCKHFSTIVPSIQLLKLVFELGYCLMVGRPLQVDAVFFVISRRCCREIIASSKSKVPERVSTLIRSYVIFKMSALKDSLL
uniref:Exosome complex component RRP46 n=1 Tax=Angiostrongylus cantonensis TaxID=6313 RepID=A0A0K0D9T9_ANGCA